MAMTDAVHDGNVVHLPFNEGQALADLCALGKTRLTGAALGRRWQWNRKRVGCALTRWTKQELIARRRGFIIPLTTSEPAAVTVTRPASSDVTRPRPVLVTPPCNPATQGTRETKKAPLVTPLVTPLLPVTNSHKWLAALAILLACACGAVGFGWSILSLARGQGGAPAVLMAVALGVIELLAFFVPSFATMVWGLRHRAFALVLWVGYAAAMGMVIFNAIGGASMQIGDMVAGRTGIIGTASDLTGELNARLAEKARLNYKPVDAAEIETAEDRRDTTCERSPRSGDCEKRRGEVTALGRQRAINERLTALDGEIKDIRGKLAMAPAVASADPQVESTMQVLALASVAPPKRAIEVGRLLGLVLIPCVMGGLLLPAGMLLWQGRRA